MENEAELNLLDLENLFFARNSKAAAGYLKLSYLADSDADGLPKETAVLLTTSGDFQPAAWQFREQVDLFLSYCGILEIASKIGYISQDELKTRYSSGAIDFYKILWMNPVRFYYQELFELPLVVEFRARPPFGFRYEPHLEAVFPLFQRFLAIELSLRGNAGVKNFIRLLDAAGAESLKAIVRRELRTPERFFELLTEPKDELVDLELAIVGLHDLLSFCRDFDTLLRDCQSSPEFRTSLSAFYSPYFLRTRQRCGEVLQTAVCQMLAWPQPSSDHERALITEGSVHIMQSISNVTTAWRPSPAAAAPAMIAQAW